MRQEVREVFHKGSNSVVEWKDENGDIRRAYFPEIALIHENGKIFVEAIEEGQPYGVDWEDYIHTRMGAKAISTKLHNKGIWTLEDLQTKTPVVTSVFNEAASINLQGFRESVLRKGKDDE